MDKSNSSEHDVPGRQPAKTARKRIGFQASSQEPPPFFLEGEVRIPPYINCVVSTATALIILGAFVVTAPAPSPPPPLLRLLAVSCSSAALYGVIRSACFRFLHAARLRRSPWSFGRTPLSGELPLPVFLTGLLTPCAIALWTAVGIWGAVFGNGSEIQISSAMIFAAALPDLRAAFHVRAFDSSCWIKETAVGLDVLRPVDRP
ncbi:MAG: hypothetical protein V2B18_07280 [Pseudomonadota bacterium]